MRIDNSMWESVFDNAIKGIESEKAKLKKQKEEVKSSALEVIEFIQDEELKRIILRMIGSGNSRLAKELSSVIKKIRSSIKEKILSELKSKKINKNNPEKESLAKIKNDEVVDTKPFYNQNLFLYLLFNDKWNCFKIGMSGDIKKRLEMHSMNGFKLIESIQRTDAKEVERKIILAIRSKGIRMGRDLFENQFDGWSECWHKDELDVKCIGDLLDIIRKDDNPEEME